MDATGGEPASGAQREVLELALQLPRGSRSGGGISRWLWARYRRRYFPVVAIMSGALLDLLAVFPTLLLVPGLLDVSWGAAAIVGGVGGVIINVSVAASAVSLRRRARPIHEWALGDRSDPEAVWNAALELPKAFPTRSNQVQLPFHLLGTAPVAAHVAGFSWFGAACIATLIVMIQLAAGMAFGVGLRGVFRPVLEEVVPLLPPDAVPRRQGWSLRYRWLASFFAACVLMSVVGAVGALAASSREEAVTGAFLLGLLLAAYFLVVFAVGIVNPTLRPVGELVSAARRVGRGDYERVVPVTTADEVGELIVAFNQMQVGLAERASLHEAFGSYVDPALARRLLESGSAMFDGEELDVTVLFADVRSFTSYAEGVTPREAVDLLNRLFDVIVPVLHAHGGHANHYLGDGLLAVFGAPSPLEHHADAAVRAAIEIQQRVREELGPTLRLGIGINTGPVIAGTIGGGGRLEFTVIGDTVNVASRVEQLTKDSGDAILVTDATLAALTAPRPRSTTRGEHTVRGKATQVTVHAISARPRAPRSSRPVRAGPVT